jgi:Cellulase (glycosyl hydrolase family 5)
MLAFPVCSPQRLLVAVLATAGILAGLLAVTPGAAVASPKAAVARLHVVAKAQHRADHRLVVAARRLKACQRRTRSCRSERRAVQRAGHRLQRTQRHLNRVARHQARRAHASATVGAPTIVVRGEKLSWNAVGRTRRYVFVRKVPGQAGEYSLVRGTSTTPPAVPGKTVRYSVRADVRGSSWAREVSISYPAVASTPAPADPAPADPAPADPTPAPAPAAGADLLAAPDITASGTTLRWNQVGDVSTYVFVRKVPGQADQYSVVSGTSTTPPAVPGETVRYSVRTAVDGSAWASEVSISYPAEQAPDPTPSPAPAAVDGGFQMGLVAGSALSWELPFVQKLGAHTARLEFGIGTSASSMASVIDQYAKAGVRPLLLASFYGRTPTAAEAQNLASWAAAYGPGGSFWQGKSYPANTAVTDIELGNETSYSYQFSDYSLPTYAARAQTYAQRAKEAATAIRAANANVGLLAIGDNAVNQDAWVLNMFKAVPNLGDYVAGWTIHPYGPNWATRIDSTISSTKAAGSRDLPIWVTEWGLSSDDGRCLDDNYGWSTCMTYSEAASTLHSVLSGMESRYGSRLGGFYLYQAHDQYASGTKGGREAYFGALRLDTSPKGAYTTEVMADLAAN